jgi:tripartite-type tricarboxylate transporter receptor subunit TctC
MHRFLLIALFVLSTNIALAWQPTRPVTVIYPNGPGAGNEISFRIVADIVEKKTGVVFKAEHRPGADGNIAINYFATVPADGYIVAIPACNSNWVTAEVWYPQTVKYNMFDFEPVANIAKSPLAFWAKVDSKVNTPVDLIQEIRSRSRPLNFAIGGGGHKLAVKYLSDALAVPGGDRIETVMYKGPAQALLDVMGGHVEFAITPVGVGYPHVKAGKLKLIGLSSEVPLKGLESAHLMSKYAPGLNLYGCWNMILPKNTPQEIQQWYHDNFVPAIRSAEAQKKFDDNLMFITLKEHTPAGVHAAMARLKSDWTPVARKIAP